MFRKSSRQFRLAVQSTYQQYRGCCEEYQDWSGSIRRIHISLRRTATLVRYGYLA